MKKILSLLSAIALCACVTLGACNKEKTGDNAKDSTAAKNSTSGDSIKETPRVPANRPGEKPNYRYVDSETLLDNYNLAKDYQEEMLRQQNNYDNTARQRQSAIESLMAKYQQQMQNNTMDEAAYNKAMADIQSRQQAAQKELGQMEINIQNQMIQAQKIVNDSIMNFIEDYNKSKGYDAIFMKQATIYISPDLDITDEVLEGLNARYNKK